MTALKLAEVEKDPNRLLAQAMLIAQTRGVSVSDVVRAINLMADVLNSEADIVLIRKDVKDRGKLWIKPCKYMG